MIEIPDIEIKEVVFEGQHSIILRGWWIPEAKWVLLKTLAAAHPGPDALAGLAHEFEITRDLDIEGIERPLKLERRGGRCMLVFEDRGGMSLAQYQQDHVFDVATFLKVAVDLTRTLGELHGHHIIHKDIKPANIIYYPQTTMATITDFSISSRLTIENYQLRNPEMLEGTLAYMSPEQTGRMNPVVDYRTDFYSLGGTFYRMLTGRNPFEADDAMGMVHAHIALMPTPPHEVDSRIPVALSRIVMKLLSKQVEQRYQSAFGLKVDLEHCREQMHNGGRIETFELGRSDVPHQFHIPHKLYGREKEVAALMDVFEMAGGGSCQLALIAGFSGIGKSALVQQLQKPIVADRGYFAAGKFDQFNRNKPYYAIAAALEDLINQILSENEKRLSHWRLRFQEALGANGGLLTELLPSLELLIGEQPPVSRLGTLESRNRFNQVFFDMLQVLAGPSHPLVLFLDDLQWADSASLDLLSGIVSDPSNRFLLVIGSYRENEVGASHPLQVMLDRLMDAGLKACFIRLQPLNLEHLTAMCRDTLWCDEEEAARLADLLLLKTRGNPFFAGRFLTALYERGLLSFDREAGRWVWDVKKIAHLDITDNVVELMAEKIETMGPHTVKVLQRASCIGSRFDLATLAIAHNKSAHDTIADLWDAVSEGLVLPSGDSKRVLYFLDSNHADDAAPNPAGLQFQFVHDRIQLAAYSLMDAEQQAATHLEIGRFLLATTAENELEEVLFDIVNQFNSGKNLITDGDERFQLVKLNFRAGLKAKDAVAFESALAFFSIGVILLGDDDWSRDHEFCLNLNLELLEAAFLNNNYTEAEQLLERLVERVTRPFDRARVFGRAVKYYEVRDNHKSLHLILVALSHLDIDFSQGTERVEEDLERERARLAELMEDRDVEDLADLPDTEDPQTLFVANLLNNLFLIFLYKYQEPKMSSLVAVRAMIQVLLHGNSEYAPFVHLAYGYRLAADMGDPCRGYDHARLGLRLAESGPPHIRPSYFNFFGHWIAHIREPLENCSEYLDLAYRQGVDCGDGLYSASGILNKTWTDLVRGKYLAEIMMDADRAVDVVLKYRFEILTDMFTSMKWFAARMCDTALETDPFTGEAFDGEVFAQRQESSFMDVCVHMYFGCEIKYQFLMGNFQTALAFFEKLAHRRAFFLGTQYDVELDFFHGLTLAACYPDASPADKDAYKRELQTLLGRHWKLADSAPGNYRHQALLLEGELMAMDKDLAALNFYERAIESTREFGFIHHEALVLESAARFFLSRDQGHAAGLYLDQARNCYAVWGAVAKVRYLERKYLRYFPKRLDFTNAAHEAMISPTLTRKPAAEDTSSTRSGQGAKDLDWATFVKTSQALSGEIVLSTLLQRLMFYVMENAGARRGFLILSEGESFTIEAEGEVSETLAVILRSRNLADYDGLSHAIVNYVARTKKSVVLSNAGDSKQFSNDYYIQKAKPKSVLCSPVMRQGRLTGLVYLENNLGSGVFTPERLEVLNLLTAQAAISLENARLYSELEEYSKNLEQKVDSRTQQLREQNREMETLDRVVETINRKIQLGDLLKTLLHQGLVLLPKATCGLCFVWTDFLKRFRCVALVGLSDNSGEILVTKKVLGGFIQTGDRIEENIYLTRGLGDNLIQDGILGAQSSRLCMTIRSEGDLTGLLIWGTAGDSAAFDHRDALKLGRFRRHAMSAISKATALKQLEDRNEQRESSIRYGLRIQSAILPESPVVKRVLPEHFVMFAPLDIVSGDFYWLHKAEDAVYVAVIDCTGHGVPGAFMTMIGNTLLNKIVIENRVESPALALELLHKGVRKALKQEHNRSETNDGMEMCLVRIESAKARLTFAGARRPLYRVAKGRKELIEIRGDRKSIGGRQKENLRTFTDHIIEYAAGDMIYLTTDGYADQADKDRRKYGTKRLKRFLAGIADLPVVGQSAAINTELSDFMGRNPRRDDITILGIRLSEG